MELVSIPATVHPSVREPTSQSIKQRISQSLLRDSEAWFGFLAGGLGAERRCTVDNLGGFVGAV